MRICLLLFFLFTISAHAKWAEQTLEQMTLKEKIGQIFVVRTVSNFDQKNPAYAALLQHWMPSAGHAHVQMLIEEYHVGGIIFQLISTIDKQIDAFNKFQECSKYPLMQFCDLERGLTQRLEDGIRFPFNMTLGALQDTMLIFEMAQKIGQECRAIGVHMNLAPVVDVNTNPLNPVIGMRSFGDNPEDVALRGAQYLNGLHAGSCAGCAKHGPVDHGDTALDSHYDLPVVKDAQKRWNDISSRPFKALVDEGVEGLVTAHLHVPDYDDREYRTQSLSGPVISNLVRSQLHFNGLVITDALDMDAITKHFKQGEAELEAFLAGNDIILCPNNVPAAVELIEKAVLESPELEQELNKRVLKILRFKERMGLPEKRYADKKEAHRLMQDQEAIGLKKKLYSQAVTLLKNDQNLLPVAYDEDQKVAVVTIQLKTSSDAAPFVQRLVSDLPGSQQFFVDKYTPRNECESIARLLVDDKYDVVIIGVFDLLLHLGERNHRVRELVDFIFWLRSQGKKTIIAFFDSPYVVGILPTPDALVLAYENDSDAQQAAADIITGKLKPMGKLPVTISEQFKRGCGLTF